RPGETRRAARPRTASAPARRSTGRRWWPGAPLRRGSCPRSAPSAPARRPPRRPPAARPRPSLDPLPEGVAGVDPAPPDPDRHVSPGPRRVRVDRDLRAEEVLAADCDEDVVGEAEHRELVEARAHTLERAAGDPGFTADEAHGAEVVGLSVVPGAGRQPQLGVR